MYHKHHTKGIILGGRVEGDHNRLLSVFTHDFGLLNVKVQGVRKLDSKLRSGSQDFCYGDFSLVHGKTGWRLVSTRSEGNMFEELKDSQSKREVVARVFSLLRKLVGEEESHPELFEATFEALLKLKNLEESLVPALECVLLLKVLHHLGYMRHDPEFSLSLTTSQVSEETMKELLPKRSAMVALINEALKATHIIT